MASSDGLLDFVQAAFAGQGMDLARHQRFLLTRLEDVARGSIDRLSIQMPPGTTKSTCASVYFPVYWMARHPRSKVITIAHTASLASYLGCMVRDTIETQGERLGIALKPGQRSGMAFSLTSGSEYFAAGVRGPITGRHADLIVIDDPIKTLIEAERASQRENLWEWYRGALLSRLRPSGAIVLAMTRWHEDDLAARLLASGDAWRDVRLPALAEQDDPLGRAPGESIWPEQMPVEALLRRRASMGQRAFAAQYQQSPRPPEEAFFAVGMIAVCDAPEEMARSVRAWDLAASVPEDGGDPDWTVGLKLGATKKGQFCVIDVVRVRLPAGKVVRLIADTAAADGTATLVALPQDPGQAGKAQAEYLRRVLTQYRLAISPESGAKSVRAMQAAAAIERGSVSIVAGGWNAAFLGELRQFPHGGKDDQVDALARAVTVIDDVAAPVRRQSIAVFQR